MFVKYKTKKSYSFTFRIPDGTETLNAEIGYVTLNNQRPVLTVYRYYRVPGSDGNLYKVYVEANEAGMHWIVEGNNSPTKLNLKLEIFEMFENVFS